MRFGLIGDGKVAIRHRRAIDSVGGLVWWVYDPYICPDSKWSFEDKLDYIVIASPSDTHYHYTKLALKFGHKVIVEKPICMPWEPLIDDDRINVCMQMRYMDLPKADPYLVQVEFRRDEHYRLSWKGDTLRTGGWFHMLYIHYIDLAMRLGVDFQGRVSDTGFPFRLVRGTVEYDLAKVDQQELYNRMYRDIVRGGGVKPKDMMLLHWLCSELAKIYGYTNQLYGETIRLRKREGYLK